MKQTSLTLIRAAKQFEGAWDRDRKAPSVHDARSSFPAICDPSRVPYRRDQLGHMQLPSSDGSA